MSEDINEGDIVVCVDARTPFANPRFPNPSTILSEGRLYRAEDVRRTCISVGVGWFVEMCRFRKVSPAETEFTQMIRACRGEPAELSA